jgi:coatomer subunit beta'
MRVKINPRDTNTFASASLDRSIKVWGFTAGTPHFSLEGAASHDRGVNCIDYYPGGDKPYLLSGADERT